MQTRLLNQVFSLKIKVIYSRSVSKVLDRTPFFSPWPYLSYNTPLSACQTRDVQGSWTKFPSQRLRPKQSSLIRFMKGGSLRWLPNQWFLVHHETVVDTRVLFLLQMGSLYGYDKTEPNSNTRWQQDHVCSHPDVGHVQSL